MAITFDAASTSTTHVSTGSNLTIWTMFYTISGDTVTAVSIGGVNYTKVGSVQRPDLSDRWVALWYAIAPPTGSQTITVTGTYQLIASASYTGCHQTTQPDVAGTTGTALAATTLAISNTSTTDNSLLVGGFIDQVFTISAGTNTQIRANAGSGLGMYDATSVTTPAGAKTLTVTPTSADNMAGVVAHIRIASTTNIKTINGLAYASIKTVNGLAIASIKTVKGLS